LKRIESGHGIKTSIRIRQSFHLADAKISAGQALARDFNEGGGGVNAADVRNFPSKYLRGETGAATDIEARTLSYSGRKYPSCNSA
jgi:hypothetical protein